MPMSLPIMHYPCPLTPNNNKQPTTTTATITSAHISHGCNSNSPLYVLFEELLAIMERQTTNQRNHFFNDEDASKTRSEALPEYSARWRVRSFAARWMSGTNNVPLRVLHNREHVKGELKVRKQINIEL